jgi:hypothetical protein
MARMNWLFKAVMFLSSYSPLFAIFAVKAISEKLGKVGSGGSGDIASIFYPIDLYSVVVSALIVVIVVSLAGIFWILYECTNKKSESYNPKPATVKDYDRMNHLYAEYLIAYVIPFLAFDYLNVLNLIILCFLLLVVGFVYIRSDLLYLNFVLLALGYSLYKVVDEGDNEYMLISKKGVSLGRAIKYNVIDDNFIVGV